MIYSQHALKPEYLQPGETLRILRTIDSFQPERLESARQAWQISNRLEHKGIPSPILTTASSPDERSTTKETLGQVNITRVPVQFSLGRYKISCGMMTYLRRYDILHSHLYRTFQTDCSFFLRGFVKNRSS